MRGVPMLMQLSRFIGRARVAAALLAVVSLVACAAAFAQSGRRNPKPREIAPVPTPTPEPTPLPKEEKVEERMPLVVVSDDAHFMIQSSRESHAVQAVVIARLRESRALEVSVGTDRASRGEAIRMAKDSKTRHVVYIELRPDAGLGQTMHRVPAERMLIQYSVFQAGTAKVMTSGTVHMQRARGTLGGIGIGVPTCYPVLTHEIEYVYGGLEVAERIMRSFSLPLPRRCG